jgi:hypothetical protein
MLTRTGREENNIDKIRILFIARWNRSRREQVKHSSLSLGNNGIVDYPKIDNYHSNVSE